MSLTPHFIILNGPPGCGKTEVIARGLVDRLTCDTHDYFDVIRDSFAAPMKNFLASSLGVKYSELKKEVMLGVLQGYTPREFLIDLSENYLKGRYHEDFFGRLLHHRVLRIDPLPDFVVIDDGGFSPEVAVLGSWTLPRPRVHVIHVVRPGKSFSGDSRAYLPDPNYHFYNDGTLEEVEPKLDHLAQYCIAAIGNK